MGDKATSSCQVVTYFSSAVACSLQVLCKDFILKHCSNLEACQRGDQQCSQSGPSSCSPPSRQARCCRCLRYHCPLAVWQGELVYGASWVCKLKSNCKMNTDGCTADSFNLAFINKGVRDGSFSSIPTFSSQFEKLSATCCKCFVALVVLWSFVLAHFTNV